MSNDKLQQLRNMIKQIENSWKLDLDRAKSEYNTEVMRANKRLTVDSNITRKRDSAFDDILDWIPSID